MECNVAIIKRMLFPFNFENIFASISLDILDIEVEKDSDTDESKNFNTDI